MARNVGFGERHGPLVWAVVGNQPNEENSYCLHSDRLSITEVVAAVRQYDENVTYYVRN